jgi:hypothetical protein
VSADESLKLKELVKLVQNMFFMPAIKTFLKADIRLGIRRIEFRCSVILDKVIFSKYKGIGNIIVIEGLGDSGSDRHFGSMSRINLLVLILVPFRFQSGLLVGL